MFTNLPYLGDTFQVSANHSLIRLAGISLSQRSPISQTMQILQNSATNGVLPTENSGISNLISLAVNSTHTILIQNSTSSSHSYEQALSTISKVSGILSLSVWLFAQLPQIIENHLNESVSGVSLLFLICWIGGDATNLIGCILTRALPFQTCLAAYYCFIDCILSLQYWYYTKVYPRHKTHHNLLQSPNFLRPSTSNKSTNHSTRRNRFDQDLSRSPMEISTSIMDVAQGNGHRGHDQKRIHEGSFIHKILGATFIAGSLPKQAHSMPIPNPQSAAVEDSTFQSWIGFAKCWLHKLVIVILAIPLHSFKFRYSPEDIGMISAWTCSTLYVSSRAPQIIKNFKLKSTRGITVYLFVFAMLGNIFYTISIVLDLYLLSLNKSYFGEDGDSKFKEVFMDQLPFIVGSSGTVLFDSIIIFQCWLYSFNSGDSRRSSCTSEYYAGHGHHHHRNHSYGSINEDGHRPGHSHKRNLSKKRRSKLSKRKVRERSRNPVTTSLPTHFQLPDWYTNTTPNFQNIDETTSLTGNESGYNINLASPPPSHYISASQNRSINLEHTMNQGVLSNTLSAIARSFSQSGSFIGRGRSPTSNSIHVGSYGQSRAPGIAVPESSQLPTSLIPSIIGNYSSVSKKMSHDSKIPFSPIDFLSDDFFRPPTGSVGHHRTDSYDPQTMFFNPPLHEENELHFQ